MEDNDIHKYIHQELEKATVKIVTDYGTIGTGFFITPDGYVMTAYHCIKKAHAPDDTRFHLKFEFFNKDWREYEVQLDEKKSNKAIDLAIFKINCEPPNCLPIGIVTDVDNTDEIIALGYAAGEKDGRGLAFYKGTISRLINQRFEIDAIQGKGQSGGPVYHYKTNRIIGLAQGVDPSLQNAGLALRFDSLFESWRELKGINDNVAKSWDKNIKEHIPYKGFKRKPNIGRLVHKTCDRKTQETDFLNLFDECPEHPQFYFIHGEEGECHESFINHLKEISIKKSLERRAGVGEENVSVYSKFVEWSYRKNLEKCKEDLKRNLITTFDYPGSIKTFSATALSRLSCFDKQNVAMIIHDIDASRWHNCHERLLVWYLNEFWDKLECNNKTPEFLIFFNVIYPKITWKERISIWKYNTKKHIRKQLDRIHHSVNEPCRCKLIEELGTITIGDVKTWLRDIYEYEFLRIEKIREIFKERKQKNMAEIEIELKKIIEEYVKENS